MKNDEVNNPSHYDLFPGQQAIDVIKAALTPEEFRGYCKGNALKYRLRAGEKGPADVDLKKSNWYRERLYEDGSAYFALMGEQASGDRQFGEKLIAACEQVNDQLAAEVHPLAKQGAVELAHKLSEPVLDPDQLANSNKSATHRDGGGNLYKVCDISGRWLGYGNKTWYFASSDPKEVPEGLRPL